MPNALSLSVLRVADSGSALIDPHAPEHRPPLCNRPSLAGLRWELVPQPVP